MTKIYIADVSALDIDPAFESVSAQRRERALRLTDEGSRRMSLGAAVLARQVLGTGVWSVSKNGKPYLPGGSVHFSLSHCNGRVLCAVSDAPVGADIERIRKNGVRLAGRFFASDEESLVAAAGEPDAEFCRIWTLKESYIKLRDMRLADMRSFSVLSSGSAFFSQRHGEYFISCCTDNRSAVEIVEIIETKI